MHSDHIQWGLSDLFHLNPFIIILFTRPCLCLGGGGGGYKWKEKSSKSCSAHSMTAGSPKSSEAGGALNSLHEAEALGLTEWRLQGLKEDLGE